MPRQVLYCEVLSAELGVFCRVMKMFPFCFLWLWTTTAGVSVVALDGVSRACYANLN